MRLVRCLLLILRVDVIVNAEAQSVCAFDATTGETTGALCEAEHDAYFANMSLLQIDIYHHTEHVSSGLERGLMDGVSPSRRLVGQQDVTEVRNADLVEQTRALERKGNISLPRGAASIFSRALVRSRSKVGAHAFILVLFGVATIGVIVMLMMPPLENYAHRGYQNLDQVPTGWPSPSQRLPLSVGLSPAATPIVSKVSTTHPPTIPVVNETAPIGAIRLQENTSESAEALPPICPALVLQYTEARFMAPLDSLLSLDESQGIDLFGNTGKKLLHTRVFDTPDHRRCLALYSVGREDDPRTCIMTPEVGSSSTLTVFGQSGQLYGYLELFPTSSRAELQWCGDAGSRRAVLQIEKGSKSELVMTATTRDGRQVGSATRAPSHIDNLPGDLWKVQVDPGIDAILITACMLALIILYPWSSEGWRLAGAFSPGRTAVSLRPRAIASPLATSTWSPLGRQRGVAGCSCIADRNDSFLRLALPELAGAGHPEGRSRVLHH